MMSISDGDRDGNLARGDDAIVLSSHHEDTGSIPEDAAVALSRAPPPPGSSAGHRTLTPAGAGDPFFKTRLCTNFNAKGVCGYAESCTFAHGVQDLRSVHHHHQASSGGGTRVCKMFMRSGACTYGANCSYLHVKNPHPHHHHHHTSINSSNPCFGWKTSGRCSYGEHCKFIHVLPPPPPPPQGSSVEAGGHKTGGSDGSSRSKCNFSFKSTVLASRLKKGSEKLNEMKKVDGIYGDWLE